MKRLCRLRIKLTILILLLLLLISVAINSVAIESLRSDVQTERTQTQILNNQHLGYLINQAVNAINQPLVEDPTSGNEFIPSAKLELPPMTQTIGAVAYSYDDGVADHFGYAELHLVSLSDIRMAAQPLLVATQNISSVMNAVPKLQACARGITIDFTKQTNRPLVYSKKLSDGRMAYYYTEPNCPDKALLSYAEELISDD